VSTDPTGTPAKRDRRETKRQVAALVVGGLVVAFALLNTEEVDVNWLLDTWQTPLIVVIALSFALGILGGMLAQRGRDRRRRR
jgi:uncharacterized integral membrane protein